MVRLCFGSEVRQVPSGMVQLCRQDRFRPDVLMGYHAFMGAPSQWYMKQWGGGCLIYLHVSSSLQSSRLPVFLFLCLLQTTCSASGSHLHCPFLAIVLTWSSALSHFLSTFERT